VKEKFQSGPPGRERLGSPACIGLKLGEDDKPDRNGARSGKALELIDWNRHLFGPVWTPHAEFTQKRVDKAFLIDKRELILVIGRTRAHQFGHQG